MPTRNHFIQDAAGQVSPDAMAGLGAILTLDVHVPPAIANALTASNQPVPPAVSGITLVDTGATMTCVHEAILTGLGLQPVGQVQSGTANGPVQQNVYMTRLVFPLLGWTVDLPVAGVDLTGQQAQLNPPQDIIALLGRNLLRNCVLIWNGVGGFWSIST